MEEPLDVRELENMERKLKRNLHYIGYLAVAVASFGSIMALGFSGLITYGNYYGQSDLAWPVVRIVCVEFLLVGLLLMLFGVPVVRRGFNRNAGEEQTEAAFRWTTGLLVVVYGFTLTVSYFTTRPDPILTNYFTHLTKKRISAEECKIVAVFMTCFLDLTMFFISTGPLAFCLIRVLADWSNFYDDLLVPLPSPSVAYKFVQKYGVPSERGAARPCHSGIGRLITISYIVCGTLLSIPIVTKLGSASLGTDIVQAFLGFLQQTSPTQIIPESSGAILTNISSANATGHSPSILDAAFGGNPVRIIARAFASPDDVESFSARYSFIKTFGVYVICAAALCELFDAVSSGLKTWTNGSKIPVHKALGIATLIRAAHATVSSCNAAITHCEIISNGSFKVSLPVESSALTVIEFVLILSCAGLLVMRKNLLTGRGTYNMLMRRFQKEEARQETPAT